MLTDKIIQNKIYLYGGVLHKVKRILKTKKKVFLASMVDGSELIIPLDGADILLSRVYTIGELAKITERRADTIRKYERRGLIPKPLSVDDYYESYKGWRFYTSEDVYEILDFFADRSPGRPAKVQDGGEPVSNRIRNLNQKVKITSKVIENAGI